MKKSKKIKKSLSTSIRGPIRHVESRTRSEIIISDPNKTPPSHGLVNRQSGIASPCLACDPVCGLRSFCPGDRPVSSVLEEEHITATKVYSDVARFVVTTSYLLVCRLRRPEYPWAAAAKGDKKAQNGCYHTVFMYSRVRLQDFLARKPPQKVTESGKGIHRSCDLLLGWSFGGPSFLAGDIDGFFSMFRGV